MEKFIPTTHLIEDRMDRVVFIATKVGFGEIVEEFYIEDNHGKHYECVTSTGVIIIKDLESILFAICLISPISVLEATHISIILSLLVYIPFA